MVKSLFRLKAVLLIVMLSMLTLSTYAGNTYYSKTIATASPTGAGKVYVTGNSADIDTIPDAKFKDSAEYLFSISYDGEDEYFTQHNEVWLYAKAASNCTFEGWALANNPTEIISTDAKFSPTFNIYSTDEEEPDVFEYIAIFSAGPSDPVIVPSFLNGEDEITLSGSDVTVDAADALKVDFGEGADVVKYASYTIIEYVEEEFMGVTETVENEITEGELAINGFGYAQFEDPLEFNEGAKYKLEIKAWDTEDIYNEDFSIKEPISTFSCDFYGAEGSKPTLSAEVADGGRSIQVTSSDPEMYWVFMAFSTSFMGDSIQAVNGTKTIPETMNLMYSKKAWEFVVSQNHVGNGTVDISQSASEAGIVDGTECFFMAIGVAGTEEGYIKAVSEPLVYRFTYHEVNDQDVANAVIEKINAIGTVELTDDCKALIDAAREAYDALTEAQQALITEAQLKVLTDAEAAYAELEEAAKYAVLTYAVADQGGVGVKVKKGEVTVDITAEECWAVATLTVNEEDKLADLAEGKLIFDMQDDATVAVTYKWADEENLYTESDIVNGIITTTAGVKVYVKEGSIYVEPDGATVSLYTVTGAKIASKTPTLKTAIFTVPAGTYIVKVGTEGIKVSVPVAE